MIFLFVIAVALLLSAFFSGIETGFISVSKPKLEELIETGNKNAARLNNALSNLDKLLAAALVGTNASITCASCLLAALLAKSCGERSDIVATLILTPIALIFCELLPKALFRAKPLILTLTSFWLFRIFQTLFTPITYVILHPLQLLINKIASSKHGAVHIGSPFATREELKYLVGESEEMGAIEPFEKLIVHHIFEFGTKKVSNVMTPIGKVSSLPETATCAALLDICKTTGLSRIPLISADNNGITGFANVYDLLYEPTHDIFTTSVKELERPVFRVKPDEDIDNLFFAMKLRRFQMAVVEVNGGDVQGIVTIQDLLDEVVGEL